MPAGEGNTALEVELSEEQRKEALIKLVRKGAPSVPPKEGEGKEPSERMQFPLRIPAALFNRVKRAASERDLKPPVNTWITEAILLQLKKEGF